MIAKKCAFHTTQNLVNFCRNPQCMLPMCPSCIKVHSAEHARQGTHGFYDCISDIHTEVQTTLQNTLKTLISNGNQLKQAYKQKQQEKSTLVQKMKQMRAKVLQTINKYIDGIQHDIMSQINAIQNITEQEFSLVDSKIQTLSQEAQKEVYNLNNQKSLKAIISHISANMPAYYSFKINEINTKLSEIKFSQIIVDKQFKNHQINQALKFISECYQMTFIEPIKRRSMRKMSLVDSNASKFSKGSTNAGSNKKVL